ncbi:MAG TPA: hypothetical protein VMU02_12050, partial [bacterium]|nr:hypothetical protein [bacterium]
MGLLGAVFAGVGLVLWFVIALRHIRPAAAALARQARALETCYSLAAVMSHAKRPISEARDEILKSVSALSADCAELARTLAKLRSASAPALSERREVAPAFPSEAPVEIKSIIEGVVSTADGMS